MKFRKKRLFGEMFHRTSVSPKQGTQVDSLLQTFSTPAFVQTQVSIKLQQVKDILVKDSSGICARFFLCYFYKSAGHIGIWESNVGVGEPDWASAKGKWASAEVKCPPGQPDTHSPPF